MTVEWEFVRAMLYRLLIAGAGSLFMASYFGWLVGVLFFGSIIMVMMKFRTGQSIVRMFALVMIAGMIQFIANGLGANNSIDWMMVSFFGFTIIMGPL